MRFRRRRLEPPRPSAYSTPSFGENEHEQLVPPFVDNDADYRYSAGQAMMRDHYERDLPPLSVGATCPKCGNDTIGTEYRPGRTPSMNYIGAYYTPEHFERRCARCGFHWEERVPDKARQFERCPWWIDGQPCQGRVGHRDAHSPKLDWTALPSLRLKPGYEHLRSAS